MKMYFHTGIVDYILFESWVPRSAGSYAGALLAIFAISFLSKGLGVFSNHWEGRWKKAYLEKRREMKIQTEQGGMPKRIFVVANSSTFDSETTASAAPNSSFFGRFFWKTALFRGLLQCLSISLHFLIMLVVMTFNVGIVITVVLGMTVGSVIFTPISYELESHSNCSN